MNLPKIHPRARLVDRAELDLTAEFHRLTQKLSTWETVQVLLRFHSNALGGIAKYAIREERHGNTDKAGDTK